MAWVRSKLTSFITFSDPENLTMRMVSERWRDNMLESLEYVVPILDKLSPRWRTENPNHKVQEFAHIHDAAVRLLARLRVEDEVRNKLAGFDTSPSTTAAGMHPLVWEAAMTQWSFGHHAEAVDAVARAVNAMVQRKLGRRDLTEGKLLEQAFSKAAPGIENPRLRFCDEPNNATTESKRQGVMDFGKGCFAAIRNPLAHLADDEIDLDEQTALESLAAFSLLARWIEQSTLVTADESSAS